jgi:predicted NBD/HSP70 family sugar kinase
MVDDRLLVGADLGGTKLLLVALYRGERVTRRVPTGPRTGPELVEHEVRSFLARLGIPPAVLGVAVPCPVDTSGVVTGCDTFPRLEGWRAEDAFADLGCPVRTLNDADAALAEESKDLRPDATAAIVVAGTWIGTAVRANGEPLRGARGWAGELGSAPIAIGGGHVTRLDHLAGGEAVVRYLGVSGPEVYEHATEGDQEALAAVREAGQALGLGLSTLVNLLNPELLALGGGALELPGGCARNRRALEPSGPVASVLGPTFPCRSRNCGPWRSTGSGADAPGINQYRRTWIATILNSADEPVAVQAERWSANI